MQMGVCSVHTLQTLFVWNGQTKEMRLSQKMLCFLFYFGTSLCSLVGEKFTCIIGGIFEFLNQNETSMFSLFSWSFGATNYPTGKFSFGETSNFKNCIKLIELFKYFELCVGVRKRIRCLRLISVSRAGMEKSICESASWSMYEWVSARRYHIIATKGRMRATPPCPSEIYCPRRSDSPMCAVCV